MWPRTWVLALVAVFLAGCTAPSGTRPPNGAAAPARSAAERPLTRAQLRELLKAHFDLSWPKTKEEFEPLAKDLPRWQVAAQGKEAWPEAWFLVGQAHFWGVAELTADVTEAVRWYQKAANAGLAVAQHALGGRYLEGTGVVRDEVQGVTWYRKAAEQGNVRAQFRLGYCYERGLGVAQDQAEAMKWYQKVADHGDHPLAADALIRIGQCLWRTEKPEAAAEVFLSFQSRFKAHHLASRAMLLAGQAYIKAKDLAKAVKVLDELVKTYQDPADKDIRAEALYWLGDSYDRLGDLRNAYRTLKKLTSDYPESKWAKFFSRRCPTEDDFRGMDEKL